MKPRLLCMLLSLALLLSGCQAAAPTETPTEPPADESVTVPSETDAAPAFVFTSGNAMYLKAQDGAEIPLIENEELLVQHMQDTGFVPCMSGDGKHLLFVKDVMPYNENGVTRSFGTLYHTTTDGRSTPQKIADYVEGYTISNDGSIISYLAGGSLYQCDTSGHVTDAVQLRLAAFDQLESYHNGTERYSTVTLTLSTDGQRMLYIDDLGNAYYKEHGSEAVSLPNRVACDKEVSALYFVDENEVLYQQKGYGEKTKIDTDVFDIPTVVDGGVYYYKTTDTVILGDYLIADNPDAMAFYEEAKSMTYHLPGTLTFFDGTQTYESEHAFLRHARSEHYPDTILQWDIAPGKKALVSHPLTYCNDEEDLLNALAIDQYNYASENTFDAIYVTKKGVQTKIELADITDARIDEVTGDILLFVEDNPANAQGDVYRAVISEDGTVSVNLLEKGVSEFYNYFPLGNNTVLLNEQSHIYVDGKASIGGKNNAHIFSRDYAVCLLQQGTSNLTKLYHIEGDTVTMLCDTVYGIADEAPAPFFINDTTVAYLSYDPESEPPFTAHTVGDFEITMQKEDLCLFPIKCAADRDEEDVFGGFPNSYAVYDPETP